MASALETKFHAAMVDIYQRAKSECGYNATRFLQMLTEYGGVETARRLLQTPGHPDGLTKLWEYKRLDISMEALIRDGKQWHPLFTAEELNVARTRLKDLGY